LFPIKAIPVELFQAIIWMVMEEYLPGPSSRYYLALAQLTLVCRQWAVILEGTPELWGRLSLDMKDKLIDLLLSRSKQSPLPITGKGMFFSFVVEKLLQHVYRWRALDVDFLEDDFLNFHDEDIENHLTVHSAPLLEELKLGISGFTAPAPLFNGSFPMLRIVHIRDYGVQWSTSVFSNLQELELSRVLHRGPDVDTFLHILANSPMLTRLRVLGTRFTHSLPSQTRVRLSHLRDLELEDLGQVILKQLVDAIDISTSTNCFFSVELMRWGIHDNYPLLEPITQRLRELANVSIGTRSTLTFGKPLPRSRYDLTMTYEGEAYQHGTLTARVEWSGRGKLAIRVARHFARQLAQSVLNLVPPTLHLIYPQDSEYYNGYEGLIFRAASDQLPGTEEIVIDNPNNRNIGTVLDYLFPRTNSHRLRPHLSTLIIRSVAHGIWAHWLQRRQERRVKEGGVYSLPLQTLILEGGRIKAGKIELLRKLVPNLVLKDVEIR
ncbi:hypothetical protein FRC01_006721, partial [Tulasnella sp. 417]